MTISQSKQLRRSYGFDEVAIVPGDITINPDQTSIDLKIDTLTFPIPIIAAAMDAVTDVNFAIQMNQLGGLAVLNLEGIQTRYDNPGEILTEIAQAPKAEVTSLLQKVYSQPIKENLIGERIRAVCSGIRGRYRHPGAALVGAVFHLAGIGDQFSGDGVFTGVQRDLGIFDKTIGWLVARCALPAILVIIIPDIPGDRAAGRGSSFHRGQSSIGNRRIGQSAIGEFRTGAGGGVQ